MWKRVLIALWQSVRWTFTGWHLTPTILYLGVVGVCVVMGPLFYPVAYMLLAILAVYILLVALARYFALALSADNE